MLQTARGWRMTNQYYTHKVYTLGFLILIYFCKAHFNYKGFFNILIETDKNYDCNVSTLYLEQSFVTVDASMHLATFHDGCVRLVSTNDHNCLFYLGCIHLGHTDCC